MGNRVQEIVNGTETTYTVNNLNQYTQSAGFNYSYDLDGNLIGKTNGVDTWSYEYDDQNRLVITSGPEGVTEYVYNGMGQLATMIINGEATNYMVDPIGFGNVVGEFDSSGALVSRYTHGLGLISKDDDYYTFDGNGNTSEMINTADEIVNFYAYEPFGKSLYNTESKVNDFQFVGQVGVRMVDDDLLNMRNRFYAPSLGRFVSEAPIGLAGDDVNMLRYVLNNLVNFIDPLGLSGFAVDFGGAYGTGDGSAKYSDAGSAGSGFYIGAKDPSNYAEIGSFAYQGRGDTTGAKIGLGVNLTRYKTEADAFFKGTLHYKSVSFLGGTFTKYYINYGDSAGWGISLFGKGIGFAKEEGCVEGWSSALQ